jgi:hypothetical protein
MTTPPPSSTTLFKHVDEATQSLNKLNGTMSKVGVPMILLIVAGLFMYLFWRSNERIAELQEKQYQLGVSSVQVIAASAAANANLERTIKDSSDDMSKAIEGLNGTMNQLLFSNRTNSAK